MKSSAYEEKQELYKKAREEMEQLYSMGETEKSASTCFTLLALGHTHRDTGRQHVSSSAGLDATY